MVNLMIGGAFKSATPLSQLTAGFFTNGDSGTDTPASLYNAVPWVYRAVNAVANGVQNIPYEFHRGGDVEGVELRDDQLPVRVWLNNRPAKIADLMNWYAGDMMLFGASYGAVVENRVRSKWLTRYAPQTITPYITANNGLEYFTRTAGSTTRYQPSELLYVWLPNRAGEIGAGTPPVAAALVAAGVLKNLDTFASAYFANGAIMPTLISTGLVNSADRERLRNWYKKAITSVKKAFNLEIVENPVTATTLGFPPRELATVEITASKREDVATALGVPQTLLWSNAANYATAQVDLYHFYTNTVIPMAQQICDAINDQVFHPADFHMEMHPERLEVFQRAEMEKASSSVSLVSAGILTTDEVRESLGYAPLQALPEAPAAPALPEPAPADNVVTMDETSSAKADLQKLGMVAEKRIRDGKPGKIAAFKSEAIPAVALAALKAQLQELTDPDDVGDVIDHAMEWVFYG